MALEQAQFQVHIALRTFDNASDISLLSATEKQQLAMRKGANAKATYIRSRKLMKRVVAESFGITMANLEILFDPNQKQLLALSGEELICPISLSHSGDALAFMFPLVGTGEFGVDIESFDKQRDYQGMAEMSFSEQEQSEFKQSIDMNKDFVQVWTLKEALTKAMKTDLTAVFGRDNSEIMKKMELTHSVLELEQYYCTWVVPNNSQVHITGMD